MGSKEVPYPYRPEVPYRPGAVCDVCGKTGSYDFMGDYICPSCAAESDEIITPSPNPETEG